MESLYLGPHTLQRGLAFFLVAITNLEVTEDLGDGIQLEEGMFLTNNLTRKSWLLFPPVLGPLGPMERRALHRARALLYAKAPPALVHGQEAAVSELNGFLLPAEYFSLALWMVKDSAMTWEFGCIAAPPDLARPQLAGRFRGPQFLTAHGESAPVSFSLNELLEARRTFLDAFVPYLGRHQATKAADGRTRLQRAVAFLTTAREARSLGLRVAHCCSCLEAIFGAGADTEIGHQVAERVACFLETDPQERLTTYKRVKGIYDWRSRVVHGAQFGHGQAKLREAAVDVDRLLRRIFNRVLATGESRAFFDEPRDEKQLRDALNLFVFSGPSAPQAAIWQPRRTDDPPEAPNGGGDAETTGS